MTSKIPFLHFDTNDLPPDMRFDAWRSAVREHDVSQPAGADPGSFRAINDVWLFGDMVVSAGRLSPVHFSRSIARAADGCDQLTLLMLRTGSWVGDLGGREVTAGPGQIVLFDLTKPMEATGTQNDNITLRLPRAAIDGVSLNRQLHGMMFDGQVGRVLADHLMLLVRYLPRADADEAAELAATTLATIASCISALPPPNPTAESSRDTETRHRVSRYVDANLGQPELTISVLCDALGMSRSVLYRAFEPLGGIAEHIRIRRLEAAHTLLETPGTGLAVADIATSLGFANDAHFSRVFRERYGYSPRHARHGKAALKDVTPAVDTPLAPAMFRQWLAQLD